MSPITTHVLDTAKGRPASGIAITLERFLQHTSTDESKWVQIGEGSTDADGRLKNLLTKDQFLKGLYRLNFDTKKYHEGNCFFPMIAIVFEIKDINEHYHVPILLSPFGYSTYRGS